jgi:hypothetical protein
LQLARGHEGPRRDRYTGWASAEVEGGDEARLREVARRMDRIFAS